MAHTISIEATAAGLQQFVQRFSPQIHSQLRQSLEFEANLPFVETDYAYTGQEGEVTDLLQPYQPQFTPKGDESYDGITSYLKPIKIDKLFEAEELEKFFSRWRANWFTPDPEQTKMTYVQYLMQQLVGPKLNEELNLVSWKGEFVAPTPGTAGAVLESCDGFKTVIAAHINSGRITPINTGVVDTAEMVAYVRDFCKAVPEPYRYYGGTIYMSKTNAQAYADDYQEKYPSRRVTEEQPDQLYLRVDHYNKTIKGCTAMEGDDRMIMVFNNLESMIIGTRTGYPRYFNFRFEPEDRNLKVFAEIYRFYNFETTKHSFFSDQA